MSRRRIPARLLPHQVIVERYEGTGAYGDSYSPPETIDRALVEDKITLVRDNKGAEQVSNATVYLELPETPIKPGSRVTRWPGTQYVTTSQVITVSVFHHPQGLSHMVLSVQ